MQFQAFDMKLALLIILAVAAGIQCEGDADESSSSKQLTSSLVRVEDNGSCGRQKVKQIELTADEIDTQAGFWPSHVVIMTLDEKLYVPLCGGTLVSKSWILTAAHCLTYEGKILRHYYFKAVLGGSRYYSSYLRNFSDSVVHDDFKTTSLENDIALLKLYSEVVFDDFIQPACVWNEKISEKLSSGDVYGNVIGWTYRDRVGSWAKLSNATVPIVPEAKCIKSNPEYYKKIVDERKFCAGLRVDTENWYGNGGGGFCVFVPDYNESTSGSWYVRGILSQSPSKDAASSDTQQYAVFTDVAKYDQWIQKHIQEPV